MIGRPVLGMAAALALVVAGGAALAPSLPAQAAAAPAGSPEPEPARLEAARQLVAVMVPPAQRDQLADVMADSVIADLSADLLRSVAAEPKITDKAVGRATVESFFVERRAKLGTAFRGTMPGMMERMARAHARMLTVEQLRAIEAFYRTPAGAAFARATPAMTSDPEVTDGRMQAITGIVQTLIEETEAVKQHLIDAAIAGERK